MRGLVAGHRKRQSDAGDAAQPEGRDNVFCRRARKV